MSDDNQKCPTSFFFFNDTATTEIYSLSLHDALPISAKPGFMLRFSTITAHASSTLSTRSEEHTSELQSQSNLVCRLLLERKKGCSRTRKEARLPCDVTVRSDAKWGR